MPLHTGFGVGLSPGIARPRTTGLPEFIPGGLTPGAAIGGIGTNRLAALGNPGAISGLPDGGGPPGQFFDRDPRDLVELLRGPDPRSGLPAGPGVFPPIQTPGFGGIPGQLPFGVGGRQPTGQYFDPNRRDLGGLLSGGLNLSGRRPGQLL